MSNFEQSPYPTAGTSAADIPTPAPADPTSALAGSSAPANGADMRSRELLDKVVRTAHQSIDRLAETAAPRLGQIEQRLHGASDALQARGEHLRETSDEWTESLRSSVRDHPLMALGIALAAGMLIARLSSDR